MNARVLKRKLANRLKRKRRVRSKISGSAELPRVSIHRSNRYLTVQAIDDIAGATIVGLNSKSIAQRANKEGAAALGAEFAKRLKAKGIERIVFDRNGYRYHGVVAAFGDALRANEIKF